MKQRAIQISRYVYDLNMKDEDIYYAVKNLFPGASKEWVMKQIKAVRENPNTYKEMH